MIRSTFRIPERLRDDVDQLVEMGLFPNRSAVLRAGAREIVRRELESRDKRPRHDPPGSRVVADGGDVAGISPGFQRGRLRPAERACSRSGCETRLDAMPVVYGGRGYCSRRCLLEDTTELELAADGGRDGVEIRHPDRDEDPDRWRDPDDPDQDSLVSDLERSGGRP